MANPQKEDGHTAIANEIMEALAKTYLSSYETQILFAIFRKTYGWNKKEDWITNTQLTIKKLVQRNIITKKEKRLSFQKDYDQWEKLPKQVTSENDEKSYLNRYRKLPVQVTENTQIGNKKLPKQVSTKDNKDTIQKTLYKYNADQQFQSLYLDLKNGWKIPADIYSTWQKLFPEININLELEKMRYWLVKHNAILERHNKNNTLAIFCVNWLEDTQEDKKKNKSRKYMSFEEKVLSDDR